MMSDHKDPVDSALETLRSEAWSTPQPSYHELENILMQEFDKPNNVRRFAQPRTLAFALALLAVGGVTFAATGGVAKIKHWFMTVTINGQSAEVELDENGESTFELETDDGGIATVSIKKTEAPDEESMEVAIRKTGDGTEDVEAFAVARRMRACAGSTPAIPLEDLKGQDPLKVWEEDNGDVNKLYFVPAEDGESSAIVLVTLSEDGNWNMNTMANVPFVLSGSDLKPEVTIGEDGLLTILVKGEEGEEQVLKLKLRSLHCPGGKNAGEPQQPDRGIKIGEDGQLTITIEGEQEEGEGESISIDIDVEEAEEEAE